MISIFYQFYLVSKYDESTKFPELLSFKPFTALWKDLKLNLEFWGIGDIVTPTSFLPFAWTLNFRNSRKANWNSEE